MADQTIRDDELAAAEDWARTALDRTVPTHLVTLLAEYDRRGAIEARTVKQVEHVLAYVPGPDPDDQGEDWHERVVAELERLRAEIAEIREAALPVRTEWGVHSKDDPVIDDFGVDEHDARLVAHRLAYCLMRRQVLVGPWTEAR